MTGDAVAAERAAPTPTASGISLRSADFATLPEALDYAAQGRSGFNFHDGRGALTAAVPYASLRQQALVLARSLAPLGRGQRLALVADTHPDFALMFYACQYAGLVPVPLPAAVHLGGSDAYVAHLRELLRNCQAIAAFAPPEFTGLLGEAAAGLALRCSGAVDAFRALPAQAEQPLPSQPHELAYLQYTSGSTRFPRGTMITQRSVMANLHAIFNHGFALTQQDRFCSWLPYYHDMGLVGIVLGCVATQRSVDYLPTRSFAMRPRLWLTLIARNRATVSFSPPFGYTLCARRLRPADTQALDLSSWRIAGVGAEMIHPQQLRHFASALAGAGFDERAFLPCYGMAECALAVSFAQPGHGAHADVVDADLLARTGRARPAAAAGDGRAFIDCGRPLPGYEIEVRDAAGAALPERRCGTIFLRGASVMSGYFNDTDGTRQVLSADGWLDTGDIGYMAGGSLHVTGRAKDLMIVKGRNIWPQDLEHIAEQQPDVRPGDASAFSISADDGDGGEETAVLVVQCRQSDAHALDGLADRLQAVIGAAFGIRCLIELVPPHTLPRTSSGKLSRSTARADFLERRRDDPLRQAAMPEAAFAPGN